MSARPIACLVVSALALAPLGCAPASPNDVEQPIAKPGDKGTWVPLAPLAAGPRQETGVVALDGEVYVIGGFDDDDNVLALVEAYDPDTDAWRRVADVPGPMHHANAAVVNGRIVVAGFLTDRAFTADGRVYLYDPEDDAWTQGAPMPAFTERGGSGVATLDGKVYVVGGTRRGAVTDVSAYDPRTDTWELLPSLPAPADHLVAGATEGVVYAVGGRSGGIDGHRPRVWALAPDDDRWRERAPMPTSRAGAAAALSDGRLYVFGGEGNPEAESGVFPHAEAYDPRRDAWEALAPMPTPRHGMGAAAIGGVLYVPGGGDIRGFAATDVHEAYIP